MKHLINKAPASKLVKFNDDNVQIKQLSVGDVKALQKKLAKEDASLDSIDTVIEIIKAGVIGADKMTHKELETFSIMDLTNLATEVMKYSGMVAEDSGNDSTTKT